MAEIVIIGGGIHGTYLSNLLVDIGYSTSDIRVIDPFAEPCQRWKELTSRTGMTFLRSPINHHLAIDSEDLTNYRAENSDSRWAFAVGNFRRPSLEMFNRHIDTVCDRRRLQDVRIQDEALAIRRAYNSRDGYIIDTRRGSVYARKIILATSSNDKLNVPDWAAPLGHTARHIFDPNFDRRQIRAGDKIVVVGGGITAAQFALWAAKITPGNVTLLVRHPLKVAEFDASPCWMGPECLNDFARQWSYDARRSIIKSVRNKGTVTPEVFEDIEREQRLGRLRVMVDEVDSVSAFDFGADMKTRGGTYLAATKIVLATGFEPGRPGGSLITSVIQNFRAPIASDGFPIPDRQLRWVEDIFVTGALAELEVGPPSRNIVGARLAGERLRGAFDQPSAARFVRRQYNRLADLFR